MKIAYLVNQYPAASHSFIRREITALERRGIEVLRIALRCNDVSIVDERDKEERRKTRYILGAGGWRMFAAIFAALLRTPIKFWGALLLAIKLGWGSERGLARHLIYFLEACLLARWLLEEKVAHVHAHFGTNSTTVAMFAAQLAGGTFSFTVHGPEEFDKPAFIGLPEKIRRARFVAAITSYCRSQLYRLVSVEHWDKIQVVRCGVDGSYLELDSEAPGVDGQPGDCDRFVCVGRLCEQKGQLLLVDAVGQLAEQGVKIRLVLAGDGPLRAPIEARIAELGLADQVTITGWVNTEQIQTHLTAARAMVLPSFAEGLPVVIMEALSLRRPVITTYIDGIPELVRDRVNGWMVPAGCRDALAGALRAALEAPLELCREMGNAGRKFVEQNHNSDTEAARLAQLFRREA